MKKVVAVFLSLGILITGLNVYDSYKVYGSDIAVGAVAGGSVAGPAGAIIGAAAGSVVTAGKVIAAGAIGYGIGKGLITFKEHTNNTRPSTEPKHQKGQARRQRDQGGEKGDARRNGNPNKRRK